MVRNVLRRNFQEDVLITLFNIYDSN